MIFPKKLGHMILEIFGHPEAFEPFFADNFLQFVIAFGKLFVFRILQIVVLDVSPHKFDDFAPWSLFEANDGFKIFGKFARFGVSCAAGLFPFFTARF